MPRRCPECGSPVRKVDAATDERGVLPVHYRSYVCTHTLLVTCDWSCWIVLPEQIIAVRPATLYLRAKFSSSERDEWAPTRGVEALA